MDSVVNSLLGKLGQPNDQPTDHNQECHSNYCLFSDEEDRVLSVAAALYYEKDLAKSNYKSNERHFKPSAKGTGNFISTFNDKEREISVEPISDGYSITIDGGAASIYPAVEYTDPIVNFGSDIIQPIKIDYENVKIQFEGNIFFHTTTIINTLLCRNSIWRPSYAS